MCLHNSRCILFVFVFFGCIFEIPNAFLIKYCISDFTNCGLGYDIYVGDRMCCGMLCPEESEILFWEALML